MDKEFMIFQIVSLSRWNEEALRSKTYEEVEKIYKDTVEIKG